MKLRNLLFGTMIACAFVGCSNDDDPIPTPEPTPDETTAVLEVGIEVPQTTKAATVMPTLDNEIKSLQLVIFDSENKVVTVSTTAGKAGANAAVKSTVKAGSQKVLVLANSTKTFEPGTSMSNVLSASKTFDTENATNGFSMNSGVFTVNVVAGKTNYVGYTSTEVNDDANANILTTEKVKLYRNVGKVILKSVKISENIDEVRYPNATLALKNVYLLHAHKTTNLATATQWGAINVTGSYLNGATNNIYANTWVKYMTTDDKVKIYPYITESNSYAQEEAYVKSLTGTSLENGTEAFYAYENTEAVTGYRTLLVVEADFSYTPTDGEPVISEGRFYPVAVGYTGSNFENVGDNFTGLRAGTLEGLLRNLEYQVNISVKGPGYTTPFGPKGDDDTLLDAKVVVVDFGKVVQNEEIE